MVQHPEVTHQPGQHSQSFRKTDAVIPNGCSVFENNQNIAMGTNHKTSHTQNEIKLNAKSEGRPEYLQV